MGVESEETTREKGVKDGQLELRAAQMEHGKLYLRVIDGEVDSK